MLICVRKQIWEGYYTNHSLRATTCTVALANGVPEKLVMERTGHRNVKSLHEYQRVSSKEREVVSDVLQLPRKSCLEKNTRESPRKKFVLDRSSVDTSSSSTFTFAHCKVVFNMK